jgi:hypothetical protein
VKNVGQVDGPIEVNVIKDNQVVETQWIEPGKGRKKIELVTANADEIVINENKHIPELYRNNNNWHQKGLFKKIEPLKTEFLIGDNEVRKTNIFWAPVLAGNIHDKLMVGAAVHNMGLPFNKFTYLVAPMYSFGRQRASGIAELQYSFLPKKNFRISRFGLSVKSFKDEETTIRNEGAFYALSPYWNADLGTKGDATPWSHNILVQGIMNYRQGGLIEYDYFGGFAQYTLGFKKRDYNSQTKLRVEAVDTEISNFVRASIESKHSIRYNKRRSARRLEIRAFAGGFINENGINLDERMRFSLNGTNGQQDLFFENYYFGRGATTGIFTQQHDDNQGAFKTAGNLNISSWMTTANIYAPLPIKRLGFIGAFADLGAFGDLDSFTLSSGFELAANVGLGIRLGDFFGIYFPLYSTDNIMNSIGSNNYADRIRFSLKLNPVNKLNLRSILN